MATWKDILREGKIEEIEVPIERRSVSGGFAFARQRYPHRDGQTVESTGREPYVFDVSLPFFDSLGPGIYPERYEELLALITDRDIAGEVEYTDPLLGVFPVKISRFSIEESATARNGARIQLQLEERILDSDGLRLTIEADGGNTFSRSTELAEESDDGVSSLVSRAELEDGFASAGYPLEGDERDWPVGEEFARAVDSGFEAFNSGALVIDDVSAQVDRFTARLDAVLAFDAVEQLDSWSIRSSLVRLRDSFVSAGERVATQDSRRITRFVVEGPTSIWSIALRLYGDGNEAESLMRLNTIPNPALLAAGTVLRVWVPS